MSYKILTCRKAPNKMGFEGKLSLSHVWSRRPHGPDVLFAVVQVEVAAGGVGFAEEDVGAPRVAVEEVEVRSDYSPVQRSPMYRSIVVSAILALFFQPDFTDELQQSIHVCEQIAFRRRSLCLARCVCPR